MSALQLPPMRLPSSSNIVSRLLPKKTIMPSSLPPTVRLFAIGAMTSISGLLYGLDTGSIGPITQMPQFAKTAGLLSSSLQGFFVASILLSASASSLCSGYVADKISRRFGIGIGALIFSLGAIVSATSHSLGSLFVGRLITGIGAGQTISVASIYLIEIATKETRGKLACLLQFSITIGIMTGYFLTYGTQMLTSSLAWRLPFIIQAIFAGALALLILAFVPFSPRWLVQQDREELALHVLRQLRLCRQSHTSSQEYQTQELMLRLELDEIKSAVQESRRAMMRQASYGELFNRRYRHRTLLGLAIMTFQQLSGIDVILYFAPIVFSSIFTSQKGAFLASGGSGIVLVLATIPAQIWVDRWGRKPPMVLGGAGMATCFIIIGSLFASYGTKEGDQVLLTGGKAKYAVVVFIYIFIALFSVTWAVVCRIYAVEIMPTRLRSRASAAQQLAKSVDENVGLVNFLCIDG
ncbi:hypothetical protein CBS101457_006062 [Exobasidium rhododendri]|nr:hypothetical protein CBS101457_006062 [Exobasidium rhododendri]